jgi:hypothetical protein
MRLSNDSFKTEQRNQHCRIIALKISKRNRLCRKIAIKIDDRCPALLLSKKLSERRNHQFIIKKLKSHITHILKKHTARDLVLWICSEALLQNIQGEAQ